jgi:hypothetical protein
MYFENNDSDAQLVGNFQRFAHSQSFPQRAITKSASSVKQTGDLVSPVSQNDLGAASDSSYTYSYNIWQGNSDWSSSSSSISSSSPPSRSPPLDLHSENLTVHAPKQLPSSRVIQQVPYFDNKCMGMVKHLQNSNKVLMCSFCKNNNEPEHIYMSHTLKDLKGRTTCPLLKLYVCPICGETGESAHTITYCKKFKSLKINNLFKH